MTDSPLKAFEDTLFVLTKKTHHCLLTLTALLKKFPSLSESSAVSEPEKIEMKRVYAALQGAVAQLAKAIPGEVTPGQRVPRVRLEQEPATPVSFDAHSTSA